MPRCTPSHENRCEVTFDTHPSVGLLAFAGCRANQDPGGPVAGFTRLLNAVKAKYGGGGAPAAGGAAAGAGGFAAHAASPSSFTAAAGQQSPGGFGQGLSPQPGFGQRAPSPGGFGQAGFGAGAASPQGVAQGFAAAAPPAGAPAGAPGGFGMQGFGQQVWHSLSLARLAMWAARLPTCSLLTTMFVCDFSSSFTPKTHLSAGACSWIRIAWRWSWLPPACRAGLWSYGIHACSWIRIAWRWSWLRPACRAGLWGYGIRAPQQRIVHFVS